MRKPRLVLVGDGSLPESGLETKLRALGYQTELITSSGQMAADSVMKLQPDLVLMSAVSHTAGGARTARRIRQLCHVPVVFAAASSDAAVHDFARQGGTDGLVVTDADDSSLRNSIETAITGYRSRTPLRHGNLAEDNVALTEEQFRRTFEHAGIGMAIVDMRARIIRANRQLERMLVYEPGELEGLSMIQLTHPDEDESNRRKFRDLVNSGQKRYRLEKRYVCKDGRSLWADLTMTVVSGDKGKPDLLVAMVVDISRSKMAEEALRQSEQRYRAIIDQAADGICIMSPQAEIVEVNKAFAAMHGYTPGELLEVGLGGLDERHMEQTPDRLRRVMNGESLTFEVEHLRKDGSRFPLEVTASLVDFGGRKCIIAFHRDIAERRKAQELLRRQRDMVSRIAETSPMPIVALNCHGDIILTNAAAEETLGLRRDRVTGRSYNSPDWRITDFGGGPFPESELPFYRVKTLGRPVYNVCHVIERPDGRRVYLSINAAPLYTASGQFDGVVEVLTDITERKQVEETLRNSEEKHRLLFDQMMNGFALHEMIRNADGKPVDYRFIEVNNSYGIMIGLDPKDVIGRTCLEVMPDTEQFWFDRYGQVALTGRPVRFEHFGGALNRYYEVTAYSPQPGQCATIFDDITERKRAEESILQHQRQLRSLASRLTLSEEKDRRRLALELHNMIGHNLASAKMKAQTVAARANLPASGKDLASIVETLDETIAAVASMTFQLSPPVLHELGLEPAIDWLATDMRERYPLQITVQDDGVRTPVSEECKVIIFQVVKELLFNVVKHAHAETAAVRIIHKDRSINITVRDDGCGFDHREAASMKCTGGGFGLFGMREQMVAIGGEMKIYPDIGVGAHIEISAPLDYGACETDALIQ